MSAVCHYWLLERQPGVEFGTVFAISLVIVALVTFLWSLIGHEESVADWKTSFLFAILYGIVQTWGKWREVKAS